MDSRITKIGAVLIAWSLLGGLRASEQPKRSLQSEMIATGGDAFRANQCFGKGGLGLVVKQTYAVLDSPRNELRLPGRKSWVGESLSERQLIVVFDGDAFSEGHLPSRFRLAESTVVSFEGDKITFFQSDLSRVVFTKEKLANGADSVQPKTA